MHVPILALTKDPQALEFYWQAHAQSCAFNCGSRGQGLRLPAPRLAVNKENPYHIYNPLPATMNIEGREGCLVGQNKGRENNNNNKDQRIKRKDLKLKRKKRWDSHSLGK